MTAAGYGARNRPGAAGRTALFALDLQQSALGELALLGGGRHSMVGSQGRDRGHGARSRGRELPGTEARIREVATRRLGYRPGRDALRDLLPAGGRIVERGGGVAARGFTRGALGGGGERQGRTRPCH